MGRRQCGYCGKYVPEQATLCPFCREELGQVPVIRTGNPLAARAMIRRGLLYMLMASAIHYLAGGYSGLEFPFTILPLVTQYLSPFLFLCGLGLALFGGYRYFFS